MHISFRVDLLEECIESFGMHRSFRVVWSCLGSQDPEGGVVLGYDLT